MAVDLHTGDTSLPYQFLPPSHELNHSNTNNTNRSALNPQLLIPHHTTPLPHSAKAQGKHKDDDLVAELTRQMQMAHFMLQHDHRFDFSGIGTENLESPWDSINWPQSTPWSPLCSNQGIPEGLSPKEPSPPPSMPANSHDSCWESTYHLVRMLEKMKIEERSSSKNHPGYGIPSMELETSRVGTCSYHSLLQEQIRAIQLARLKQEQTLSVKKKLENHGHITQQFQKKGKGLEFDHVGFGNGRRARPARPGPPQQQTGSEMQALFLGSSASRGTFCGTGVFLPRGGTSAPSESRKRPGKGCSTVLIPARVVQALQLHFDQMAATSGPKPGGFPPLHGDVLVSNRDGMYSLQQRRQSRRKPAHIQHEMILPREWTY